MIKYAVKNILTVLGLLPFLFATILLCANVVFIPIIGPIASAANLYATIIISFLLGSQWGYHLNSNSSNSSLYALSSNFFVILLVLFYLWLPVYLMMLSQIVFFLVILWQDYSYLQHKDSITSYLTVRIFTTVCVVLLILIMVCKI